MNNRNFVLRCRFGAAIIAQFLVAGTFGQTTSYYFVAPSATIASISGAAGMTNGMPAGYSALLITPATVGVFTNSAPPNLVRTYSAVQSGTALRARLNQVLQINRGLTDVRMLLIDDQSGIGVVSSIFATAQLPSGQRYIWPAAALARNASGNTNRYTGYLGLGTVASQVIQGWPGGWAAWEQTILHEHLHTQFAGQKTKWGSINIVYGGDNAHYVEELLGEQELPFEEGLGTFLGATLNIPHGVTNALGFFQRSGPRYIVESRSVLAGEPQVWNAPHIENDRPIPATLPQTGGYSWRYYSWIDIPGFFVQFGESTSTAFHLYFWQNVYGNRDQALDMILSSARSMAFDRTKRYLTYAVNRLAVQMESTAPVGPGTVRTSSMFPFALLDVLTHFGMTDDEYRQEYGRNYPETNPRAFTEYWHHRNAVRNLTQPFLQSSPIRMNEAVAAIHQYFLQNSTILVASAGPSL
jgi:hypothetical protein